MNRRSVLGMLGIGAAVGPSVAKSVASPPLGGGYGMPLSGGYQSDVQKAAPRFDERQYIEDEVKEIVKSFKRMTEDRDQWIADMEKNAFHELRNRPQVDVDIIAMKSFSDIAKLKLQARRVAERDYDSHHQHLSSRKENLLQRLKQLGNIFGG